MERRARSGRPACGHERVRGPGGSPDAVAVVSRERAQVRRAGPARQPAGAPPGAPGVGPRPCRVAVERSLDLLVGPAGRAQGRRRLPAAGPGSPPERLRVVHRGRGLGLLIDGALRCRPGVPRSPCLPVGRSTRSRTTAPDPPTRTSAYAIYTSGSTGQPKGWYAEHRASPASGHRALVPAAAQTRACTAAGLRRLDLGAGSTAPAAPAAATGGRPRVDAFPDRGRAAEDRELLTCQDAFQRPRLDAAGLLGRRPPEVCSAVRGCPPDRVPP